MNKKFFITALITIFSIAAYAQTNIDLKTAVNTTLQKYPLISKLSSQADAIDSRVEQLKSNYLPTVEGEADYTRIGPVSEFVFGPLSEKVFPENNYDAHVRLNYTLFDFGKRDAIMDVTASGKNAALDNVELAKTNLAFQVVQAYYYILYLQESLKLKQEQIDNLNSHLKLNQDKVKSGTATDFDVLSTQVKISAVQNQQADLRNEMNKQAVQLKTLMGLPSDAQINLSGGFTYNMQNYNADSLFQSALSQRSEIKLSKDNELTSSLQKVNAQKTELPNLQFILQYGFKNGYIPNLNAWRGNYVAGVDLRYPIYSGNKKEAMVQEAEALLKSNQSNTSEIELTVKSEILKVLSDLNSIDTQLQNTKVQIDHAAKSVERSELQYKEGTLRNLDLLDAQTNLSEAKFSQLQLVFRNIMTNYMLQKATGKKFWE